MWVKVHAYVSADGMISNWLCKDIHGKKLRIRKRFSRVRFYNQNAELIKDYIEAIKIICPHLSYIRHIQHRNEVDIRSQILAKGLLKLGDISTKSWQIPKDLSNRQKRIWARAFADCDGTVGYYNYDRYVSVDSINLKGLKQLVNLLNDLGITSRIQKVVYKENESYRLRIYRKENLFRYYKLVGFTHPKKQEKLSQAIQSYKLPAV